MITKEALIITCTILGFLRIFYSIMGPKTIRIIKAAIVHSSLKPLQDQHLVGLVICSAKALERSVSLPRVRGFLCPNSRASGSKVGRPKSYN